MNIDRNVIVKVAELSRLELSEDEMREFEAQLGDIIKYVEKINELDTEKVAPTDHIVDLMNVFRKDVAGESLAVSELEKIAPQFEDGHVVVPRIIEES
ncbi:MAG TPA: Asp-tRNA(Asn)/Glu-tRNA(Gln) amidotransferase subunit GatC [Spirochaetota bacterium]|nr:Asp-tRNA(Asn)/Glu-tRNA(Gln) amidotransferase subunit GatC [Spirochaetota bacterium]HPJ38525.1 Asp-tRNA(Asn)/Glu-tRNA(Gln) amidotransferase subunit GatC [Spirochaetota bacterium]HPQ53736.1 Asp-tRNA(Asn)/Glu-tRNA(Gln) amidotransferase subunit GatC [Spirochaetota bacterium]